MKKEGNYNRSLITYRFLNLILIKLKFRKIKIKSTRGK